MQPPEQANGGVQGTGYKGPGFLVFQCCWANEGQQTTIAGSQAGVLHSDLVRVLKRRLMADDRIWSHQASVHRMPRLQMAGARCWTARCTERCCHHNPRFNASKYTQLLEYDLVPYTVCICGKKCLGRGSRTAGSGERDGYNWMRT